MLKQMEEDAKKAKEREEVLKAQVQTIERKYKSTSKQVCYHA
jgi:hypothetical protein